MARDRLYSPRQWQIAALFFVSYIAVYELCRLFVPVSAQIYPASALALGALFFGGVRLWPVVYAASLVSAIIAGMPLPLIIILPIAEAIQASAGAYLLRLVGVDPLFRRYRDTFYFIATAVAISLIVPALRALGNTLHGAPYTLLQWGHQYTATVFCLLIITPFILRWFAKPRFSRTPFEIFELVVVFGLLLFIDYRLFLVGGGTLVGIPASYFLLIPFFWIALRLRPRFLTLALLITSIFAIWSTLAETSSGALGTRLFDTEVFLIALAIVFYIIVSLEEDRRVNTNLMRTQMSTLQNAVARISSESKAKNDFIAILAHELRNPLAPIVSAIELLKLKGSSDPEDAAAFAMMDDRMGTVRQLLDDLLDISRISEGKISLKNETLDLEEIVNRAVLSTAHHRKERHQSLNCKVPHAPVYVRGDALRIEQIFSNLLKNASKYSDSGDAVTLIVRDQGDTAEIEVADQGVGIGEGDLDAIFTPFHQVEQGERSRKGLGIGLSLVRSFAELHGGSVSALSKGAGFGSRFIVRLPITHADRPSPSEAAVKKPFVPRTKHGPSVLVVDDNDAAAAGIGRLLELSGCAVSYAYDGAQAIDEVFGTNPDVVLLDIGLPDQEGYDVALTLRRRGYKGRLIALTGYSTEDARERGKDAGFENYLVKPAGLAELRRVLPELN